MTTTLSSELLEHYFSLTKAALEKAQQAFHAERRTDAAMVFDMASRYYADARYFVTQGDPIRAFAALNYAHGWLDAGARLGLFQVHDSRLFAVDSE